MKQSILRAILLVLVIALTAGIIVFSVRSHRNHKDEEPQTLPSISERTSDEDDEGFTRKPTTAKDEDETKTKTKKDESDTKTKTKAGHEHVWVTHKEVGHWEEDVRTEKVYVCDGCDFVCGDAVIMADHMVEEPSHKSYHTETIKVPGDTSSWVVDEPAYEYCSICGIKKSEAQAAGSQDSDEDAEEDAQAD